MRTNALLPTVLLAAASLASASEIHVAPAPLGRPDGAGTCVDPIDTLAAGLALADGSDVHVVRLAGGTYRERGLVVAASSVLLKGGYAPDSFAPGCDRDSTEQARDPDLHVTVIDGEDAGRILELRPVIGPTGAFVEANRAFTVAGVTFTRGHARADDPVLPTGGALLVRNYDDVLITNCVFTESRTSGHLYGGGAISVVGYNPALAGQPPAYVPVTVDVVATTFRDNRAGDGVTSSGFGGALLAWDGNVDWNTGDVSRMTTVNVRNSTFEGNTAHGVSGLDLALCGNSPASCAACEGCPAPTCSSGAWGGGAALFRVAGDWVDDVFRRNAAIGADYMELGGLGGGLYAEFDRDVRLPRRPAIERVLFEENRVQAGLGSVRTCGSYSALGAGALLVDYRGFLGDCDFVGNVADATAQDDTTESGGGGGLYFVGHDDASSSTIFRTTFSGNRALGGGSLGGGTGGGLKVTEISRPTTPVILECTFSDNGADSATGQAQGGGLHLRSDTYAGIIECLFERNWAGTATSFGAGGGAYVKAGFPNTDMVDTILDGNTAGDFSADLRGPEHRLAGIVYEALQTEAVAQPSSVPWPQVVNDLIVRHAGVGLALLGSQDATGQAYVVPARVEATTIADNSGPGVVLSQADGTALEAVILHGNDRAGAGLPDVVDAWGGGPGSPSLLLRDSILGIAPPDLQAQLDDAAEDNTSADPVFVDREAGDYHLDQFLSPAVNRSRKFAADVLIRESDMATGRTTDPAGVPDGGFMDAGFHYLLDDTGGGTDVVLRITDAITALAGGPSAGCGPATSPPMAELASDAGYCEPADFSTGCPGPRLVAGRTVALSVAAPAVLTGAAVPGAGGVLELYEAEGCTGELHVSRDRGDLIVTLR